MAAAPSPLRFAFAGMVAMAAAMGIGRFVYTPILPGMMQALGLSPAQAGAIASANYLGYLLGALLAAGGWAHGRERALMLTGLAASTVLAVAMGLSGNLVLFIVIRFLAGLASAFVMVFLASIVFSHLAAARRDDLQAVHFSGVGVGIAISSAMMLALHAVAAPWQAGWWWSGAISAIAFLFVAATIDRGPAGAGERRAEPRLPRDPALRKLILAYGLFGLGYVVTATFLIAIVRQGDGGQVFEGIVWLVTGLVGVPSVAVWNRVAARTGLTTAYALGCLIEAAGVAVSVLGGGIAGPIAGGILLGSTFIALTALGLQAARRLAPEAPRRVFALMTASFGLGQIVGPLVAGTIAGWSGGYLLPSLAAALALLISGAVAWSAGSAPKSP